MTTDPLKIDDRPLYIRLRDHLRGLVDSGDLEPGHQLRSEYELAAEFGVSRNTVREALLGLEQDGIVVRRHGVGTFVATQPQQPPASGLEQLESTRALLQASGVSIEFAELEIKEKQADQETADQLKVDPGTVLTAVQRVVLADGSPAGYMVDLAPRSVLSPSEVKRGFKGSVLDLLRRKQGLNVAAALTEIIAATADPFLAQKLRLSEPQALLLLKEAVFDTKGAVLEVACKYFIPGSLRIHLVRR
ncbi:MAG: GntR family transcriptional regulator [Anaerolineae bacterium]|jgi:GntR family transcriptional regulator